MNYKTVADLNADTRRLKQNLPKDIDLVVGIPRSGLLAANLLCLYLDVPMTDVDRLCEGKIIDTGERFGSWNRLADCTSVLVIDDSVATGNQMTETRTRLDKHDFPFDIEYGAIYVSPRGYQYVDYWSEVVPFPRVFEWNIFHHTRLTDFCVDLDGVLCRDPIPHINDDKDNDRELLTNAEPNMIPNQRIGWLVSSRLETFRPEIEQWLAAHGINYETLVMRSTPETKTRRNRGNYAEYKARVYDTTDSDLFIENDPTQAAEICERTNRPVFCSDTNEMLKPGMVGRSQQRLMKSVSSIQKEPISFPARTAKRFSSQCYHQISRYWRSKNKP